MLTQSLLNSFERTQLKEDDIFAYEEQLYTTSTQDVSTQTNYVIETRNHSADSFMDIDNAYLAVKFKIVLTDGTDLAALSRISLTHGAWSLFNRVELEVNQQRVDFCDNPGQAVNILHKASKSYDWLVDNGSIEFYYPSGFSNGIATVGTISETSTDSNWLAGALRTTLSHSVWAKAPLKHCLGFCNIERLLNGVNIVVRLEKNEQYNNILMRNGAGDDEDGKTVIQEIRLYVPTVKVSPEKQAWFASEIKNNPMIIDWQQIYFQRLSGQGTALNLNLFTGAKRPRHLFVMPQLQSELASQEDCNGGLGASNTVTECFITVNGIQYPFSKFSGETLGYLREVEAVKRAFGKHKSGDASSIIRIDNFASYHSIYYFDLSHVDSLFEANNQSDAIIKLTFTSAEVNSQYFNCVLIHDMHHKLEMIGGSLQVSAF